MCKYCKVKMEGNAKQQQNIEKCISFSKITLTNLCTPITSMKHILITLIPLTPTNQIKYQKPPLQKTSQPLVKPHKPQGKSFSVE